MPYLIILHHGVRASVRPGILLARDAVADNEELWLLLKLVGDLAAHAVLWNQYCTLFINVVGERTSFLCSACRQR